MPKINIVAHEELLFADFKGHFLDESTADVIFIVEGVKLPAHRLMLASHSKFFKTLLYEKKFKEANQDEVELKETEVSAFKIILEYFYIGWLDLDSIETSTVLQILELSKRYDLEALIYDVSKYLELRVNKTNVNGVLEVAVLLKLEDLEENCWWIIAMAVEGIYEEDLVLELDPALFRKFLSFCSGKVSALKLFEKATKLLEKNLETPEKYKEMKLAIKELIEFSRISADELYEQVLSSNVFSEKEFIALTRNLLNKGWLEKPKKVLDKNLFDSSKCKLVDGETDILDLGKTMLINHISIEFPIARNCKYYLQVSTDMENWLIIYKTEASNGPQKIYITEIGARYIRFGFEVSEDNEAAFEISFQALEASYVSKPPAQVNGCVWQIEKIPPSFYSFHIFDCTISEMILCEESLDIQKDNETNPFISQKLSLHFGMGCFCVDFRQPFLLDSFRFRLWDYDGRKYHIKVQIETGLNIWLDTVDEKEDVGGMQVVTFSPRPVYRIFIYCNKTTVGDDLRISYFEAPAQPDFPASKKI